MSRRSIFQLPIQRMALTVPEPSRHTHHRTVRLIPWLQLHAAPAHDQHLLPPHQRVWRGRSAGRATRSAPPTSTPGAAMSYRSRRSPPCSSWPPAARHSTSRASFWSRSPKAGPRRSHDGPRSARKRRRDSGSGRVVQAVGTNRFAVGDSRLCGSWRRAHATRRPSVGAESSGAALHARLTRACGP